MLENGLDVCNCKKIKCERHGKCQECLEHHRLNKRYPPYCKREGRRKERRAEKRKETTTERNSPK